MNHERQLDLRLARSKEFGLLLKLIFYNSFEVITRFPRPFNQRNRFKAQFHAIVSLVEKTFQTANKKGRAERKLLHVKMSSAATPYAVRTRPRAIPLTFTKIFHTDGLPYFLTQDAPRAAAPPEAPLLKRARCIRVEASLRTELAGLFCPAPPSPPGRRMGLTLLSAETVMSPEVNIPWEVVQNRGNMSYQFHVNRCLKLYVQNFYGIHVVIGSRD